MAATVGGNADVATMLRKGQSKRGHALVGFHAAAASPAPQPMKKLRAGSSHVDPPLRIGQSASPAVQSGTHAAPTTAASGRARPNALVPPPRRPFPSPPDRPPSSATDAANTALLAAQATAATVAANLRVAGARGADSPQSGGRSSRPDQAAEQAVIAAEADGLGRVLPGGAPAKEPAEAGAIGEAAVLVPAADAPAAILAVEAEPEAAEPGPAAMPQAAVSIEKDVLSTYVIPHPSIQPRECNSSFDRSHLADVLLSIRV